MKRLWTGFCFILALAVTIAAYLGLAGMLVLLDALGRLCRRGRPAPDGTPGSPADEI